MDPELVAKTLAWLKTGDSTVTQDDAIAYLRQHQPAAPPPPNTAMEGVGRGLGDLGSILKALGQMSTAPQGYVGSAAMQGIQNTLAMPGQLGRLAGTVTQPHIGDPRGGVRFDPNQPFLQQFSNNGLSDTVTAANTPGALAPEQRAQAIKSIYGAAALPLTAELGPFGIPAAAFAGSQMTPGDPWRGATAAAVPLGVAAAIPAIAQIPQGIVGMAAKSRVANAASEVPGGAAQLPVRAGEFTAPGVPNALASPKVFDLHSGLSNALTKAMGDNPAVRAYWEDILTQREAARTPTVSEGIRQATYQDLSPKFDEIWAKNPQVNELPFREKLANLLTSPKIKKVWNSIQGGEGDANVAPDWATNFTPDQMAAALRKAGVSEKGIIPGAADGVTPPAEMLQTLKLKLEGLTEQARRGGAAKRYEFGVFKDAKDLVNDFLNEHVPDYQTINEDWARRMQLADKADATLGPGIKLGAHSTSIEPTNPGWTRAIQKTAGKLGLDAWDRAVSAKVSDMLATNATPADIQQFLAELPKRGTYTPKLLPRSGFFDYTKMTPAEQADALAAARRTPPPAGFTSDIAPGPDATSVMAQQAQREGGNTFFKPTSAYEKIMPHENESLFEQFLRLHPKP